MKYRDVIHGRKNCGVKKYLGLVWGLSIVEDK